MPKYLHYTFKEGGIALWKIEETAEELYTLLSTPCYDEALASIHNDGRRVEWLAVRVLLANVLGKDKEIAYYENGAPFLTDNTYRISISHTKGYAALAYNKHGSIGVDVECISNRVMRVVSRFTRSEEFEYIDKVPEEQRLLYCILNWSAKETLFKYVDDNRTADFKRSFLLFPYAIQTTQGEITAKIFLDKVRQVHISYLIFPDFVCTFCME